MSGTFAVSRRCSSMGVLGLRPPSLAAKSYVSIKPEHQKNSIAIAAGFPTIFPCQLLRYSFPKVAMRLAFYFNWNLVGRCNNFNICTLPIRVAPLRFRRNLERRKHSPQIGKQGVTTLVFQFWRSSGPILAVIVSTAMSNFCCELFDMGDCDMPTSQPRLLAANWPESRKLSVLMRA